jgi:hypothetical protein
MSEKFQEILIATIEKAQAVGGEIYDATKNGLGNAVDFAKEQIPDVISQLMMWEFAYHAAWTGVWLLFIAVLLGVGVFIWKKGSVLPEGSEDRFVTRIPIFIAILVSFITIYNGVVDNALVCAKVKFAPKVFLIEYCAELIEVKKHNADEKTRYYRHFSHNH